MLRARLDDDPETEIARVTIEDSGVGIRPEFLPFVFERFRQEDSSMTRRHGGLGLGLAIVKHLVGVHGGRVKAESDGEGKGAVFIVELPAIEVRLPEAPVHEHPVNDGQSLQNLAILLVEDDEQTNVRRQGARAVRGGCLRRAIGVGGLRLSQRAAPEHHRRATLECPRRTGSP